MRERFEEHGVASPPSRSLATAHGAVLSGNTADMIGFSSGALCHGGAMAAERHATSSFARRYLLPSSTVHSAGG